MKFRKATISDISTLNKISLASKKYWGYSEDWIEHWIDDLTLTERDLSVQEVVVLDLQLKIIGFCATMDQGAYYEVMHLWILPEFIGKGYGKMLLKKALSTLGVADKPIEVTADPYAELFYKKQGFKTISKVESYPKGRFLPLMKMDSTMDH